MTTKPIRHPEFREVKYRQERWALLEKTRKKALHIMQPLRKSNLTTIVHGSIARGDVSEKSDIDIFIPMYVSSFAVEAALERATIRANRRFLVQATPTYAMKAHIEIDENTCISFPLMKLRKVEREFYRFGGEATLKDLENNVRTLGVDKRLMLIEPTAEGHRESTITGEEEQVSKRLGISVDTVLDRVRALLRRDEIGRTGVFIKRELNEDETFEMSLENIAAENPAVRRRLTRRD